MQGSSLNGFPSRSDTVLAPDMLRSPIAPAGWPLRHFNLDELTELLGAFTPGLIEISKDLIRDDVSLKSLGRILDSVRGGSRLSFAGTTDLVSCAGLSWERYRRYLAVQFAQARFLDCSDFRLLVGGRSTDISTEELVRRIEGICDDLAPIAPCLEIHGGMESDPDVLAVLLRDTPVQVVLDFQNVCQAGWTSDEVLATVPVDRIVYFHQRNLPGVWTEHPASLEDEACWQARCPDAFFLWEPKTVDEPFRIRELYRNYRNA